MDDKSSTEQEPKRTKRQNDALHLYLSKVATALNDAGYSIQDVLSNFTMELDWTPNSVKEILWRQPMKSMLHKDSTTDMTTKEIDQIYLVLNRFLGEKLHMESIPFPSIEELMHQALGRKKL